MRKHILIVIGLLILVAAGILVWLGWPDKAKVDFADVTGQRPQITEPRRQMIPTVKVAKAVGWPQGAAPTAAEGLTVTRYAEGFDHPRWLYRLPNGDILVAETNSPPREGGGITGAAMKLLMGRGGAAVPSANRITLLRDSNGDGRVDEKHVFMTGLNSPHGMTLFEGQLYIANTDALVRVPYTEGATKVTAKPETCLLYTSPSPRD